MSNVRRGPRGSAEPPRVVAVVGATASGKSELALDLAERLGGEIVNTDAMQVYVGMDIGTAKVPVAERRGIPHHLLDLLDVTQTASVAAFQALARAAVRDARARGVTPVLVGGSALYTRAVLDDLEFPGTDAGLRVELETEAGRVGPAAMHDRLREVDPVAAGLISPANVRRVVRALEVVTLTGRPFRATLPPPSYVFEHTVQVGLAIDRPVLDERIRLRVEQMWSAGLVHEVRRLVGLGLREGRTAGRALGYQQVLAHLDGACSEREALEATVVGTRRFARRQDSWFGRDDRITWLRWDDPARVERSLEAIGPGQ